MKEYYFTFRSVTKAMEAEKRLKQVGLSPNMIRTPAVLRKKGCGYSLRLRESEWTRAQTTLTVNGYERLFYKDGQLWEEVKQNVF